MAIAQNFPLVKPSLLLDFSNTEALDSRVTFARASTATYYGTQTAKAEQNLLTYSQEFNTGWTYNSASVTGNTTVAPDGTTTADTIAFVDTAVSRVYQAFAGNGSAFTFSVFAKYIDKQWIAFLLVDSGGVNRFVWFDVQNGVVGTTQAGITASIVASTNGFYRCIATINTTATSNFAMIYGVNGDGSTSNVGQTGSIAAWGAQLEQRSAVTAYQVTTTQPITNYIPVLETAASGVARFDHNPTTFESLGLLIEEQRTNLALYSEDFSNAAWTKSNSTVTANTIVAPDGTLTTDKLIANSGTQTSRVSNGGVAITAQAYTFTVYAKRGEKRYLQIFFDANQFNTTSFVNFDLQDGVLGTVGSTATASIDAVGNGFYRCRISATSNAATTPATLMYVQIVDSATAVRNATCAGNGFDGIYIWGAQLEAGAFSTSYVQTVASQVTRAADSASMTGTNFSDWYRADEGTLYGEVATPAITGGSLLYALSNSSLSTQNTIYSTLAAVSHLVVRINNATTVNLDGGTYLNNVYSKTAGAYKVNDFAVSLDSGTVATNTNSVLPLVDRMFIGANSAGTSAGALTIKKIAYYPQRLTNTQLQALTS